MCTSTNSCSNLLKRFYNEIHGDQCVDFGANTFRDSRSALCICRVWLVAFKKVTSYKLLITFRKSNLFTVTSVLLTQKVTSTILLVTFCH